MKLKTTLLALACTIPLAGTAAAQTRLGNDAAAISQALVGFGFAPQFRMVDRELVRTVVEACRGRDMFRVSVNVLGAVKTKERRGRCDIPGAVVVDRRIDERDVRERRRALRPRQVRRKLRDEGYTRIEMTDRELPRYVAEACDGRDRRVELVLNRRGEVRRRNVIGSCRRAVDAAAIEETLRGKDAFRVDVERNGRRFVATVCEDLKRVRYVFSRFGEQQGREEVGKCRSRSANDILSRLYERGARDVALVAEGCFKNVRYRWAFNHLGDRIRRDRIGNC